MQYAPGVAFRNFLVVAISAIAITTSAIAQEIPIHYYNGASRVDLVVSGDELAVIPPKGATARVPFSAGAAAQVTRAGHAIVNFATRANDRAALVARARAIQSPNSEVAAVAYRSADDRGADRRIFIPNKFTLKPAPGQNVADLARAYSLRVIEQVSYAPGLYIVATTSTDLFAGVDAANAMFESGQADIATPLVLQQQKPRLIPNDPYFGNQWHLRNIGQVPGGVSGNDVNIISAWDSYTGTGINIAISDSGVQNTHVDLSANARTDIDIDINDNDADPTPQFDSHGTSCAGMAAANGNNGLGVVGAAFNAGIVGIRLIEAPTSDQDEANAMNHQVSAANPNDRVYINSNSWGPSDNGQNITTFGPLTEAALINGLTNGRGGKGVIYVWAGGNGRQNSDNVNYDGYASSRYTISVGASGGNGAVSYYSEPGASLLVNAPSLYASTGTTTTTFMNQGNLGSHYTTSFGGTSSAAPLAAGVIALILEANPNLTWRDVQHILVETATKNVPSDPGWTTNGAGHDFNEDYGFGRINAAAAVALAQTWTLLPAEATPISGSQTVNLAIPDNSNTGVSSVITVTSAPATFRTEAVEVTFNATHGDRGNLEITLTAPSGQQAVLARERFDFGANYSNWRFTSVASWDENPNGVWTLLVKDLTSGTVGTFDSWTLSIHGYDSATALPDTDGDLIPDIYETNTGVFVDGTNTGSDPNNPDTDGDGVIDGTEVDLGTDPNNANDTPDVPAAFNWGMLLAVGVLALIGSRAQRRNG